MDKLLELLGTYDCHLNRGEETSVNFLRTNYQTYINDVKAAILPDDNPFIGTEMCEMVAEQIENIEKNSNSLIEVLELYNNGRIVEASQKSFEVFDNMKTMLIERYSGAFHIDQYYRIRTVNGENSFDLERKELFHIPVNKRHLVRTERYSMPGHPCLYLSSQAELCWYECGKPQKFVISKVDIPQNEDDRLKLIDFSEKLLPLQYSFVSWFTTESETEKEKVRRYLLKHICTYPLRAACSIVVKYPGSGFIEEYIVPQLLLQWVLKEHDFDGIRYESCSSSDDVQSISGHNVVLVTDEYDEDGFDVDLRKKIKLGVPVEFDIEKIEMDLRIGTDSTKDELKKSPFLWGLQYIPDKMEEI